jgi:hypothetical protein
MNLLGLGLSGAGHWEDVLAVREAELSTDRRICAPEHNILASQGNLANAYQMHGRLEETLKMYRDVQSGYARLLGEETKEALLAVFNRVLLLHDLERLEEAKSLVGKTLPTMRRALGECDDLTLRMKQLYAEALYKDDGATLDYLREAESTLVETERTARQVLGGAHPTVVNIEIVLRNARAVLGARETSR